METKSIKEKRGNKEEEGMSERQAIHINLISVEEMKAHTKEIRSEMDGKFVECLMATGVTRAEALQHVREWNASKGYGYNGY